MQVTRVASTGEVELAAYELDGAGPPLLLCHATGFCAGVWTPLAAHVGERFRCVALDFRGHGDSSPPAGLDFSWTGFADDVLAVVDALDLGRPFGVGHSKGGAALLMAEHARPGTFPALWCYEPIVFPPRRPGGLAGRANPLAEASRRRRETFPSREDAIANFAAKPPLDALAPEALRAYVAHGFADTPDGVRLKCPGEHEARVYEGSTTHETWDLLPEIGCPVTVACGAGSTTMGPAMVEELAGRLPRGRPAVLDGLGHFGPLEDPARVARAVAADLLGGGGLPG